MKSKFQWILTVIVLLSFALTACGQATVEEAPPAEAEVEEAEAPAEEAEAEAEEGEAEEVAEEEPAMTTEADLDAAFGEFLAGMEAYNTISLEALNEMMVENPPFLLDVRTTAETEERGHIPGSVTIPLNELGESYAYLPAFDQTIVSYCGSGWRCTIALTGLGALGWDVKGLKGNSYSGWVEAGYATEAGLPAEAEMLDAVEPDPAVAAAVSEMFASVPEGYGVVAPDALNTALVENPDLILVDVRTAAEVEEKGSIDFENQVNIPLEEFVAMRDMWPAQDAPIVVYCGSGHRSTMAMTILWTYGYTDVGSLKGGFGGWAEAGYPTTGGSTTVDLDGAFNTFLADMEGYNTISLDALNTMMVEEPPFVLDVRSTAEVEENGYIEGAVVVPLPELTDNLDKLPAFDQTIVSYCGSGWRCTIALTALEAMGWEDVKGLKGGSFASWVEAGYPVAEGLPEAEVLDAATVDPALVSTFDAAIDAIPEGWGVITADNFNLALGENPDLQVIDVRTDAELAENGVIEAANWTHIPLEEFVNMQDQWPADKDAQVVVYCGSGHRSTIAMTILYTYGYTNVSSLKGGFGGWVDAGYPVMEYAAE